MKKLILISALLLFASNGWANEAFDNCIAVAEEAKNNVLEPTNWSKIEDAIDKEEALIPEMARAKSLTSGSRTFAQIGNIRREVKLEMQQAIEEKRIQLEYDKQEEQSRIMESKRDAIKDYIELLRVCADLNVIKFEGEVQLKE